MTYELLGVKSPEPRVYQSSTGTTICELQNPIDFPCEINRKPLTASLTKAEDDGTKWLYHIRFSDGYKSVFTVDRKRNRFVEKFQSKPSAYLKAIESDIEFIYQFHPFLPQPCCVSVNVNGEAIKVWMKQEKEGCWIVYYKNKVHFFVHLFSGRWQHEPLDNIAGTYVVPEIVEAVTEMLDRITRLVAVNAPSNN